MLKNKNKTKKKREKPRKKESAGLDKIRARNEVLLYVIKVP